MRVALAGLLYAALSLVAGVALGPVRVLVLEPRMGPTVATLIEAPLMIVAMFFASRLAIHITAARAQAGSLFAAGMLAFVIVSGADVLVGRSLRGLSIEQQIGNFSSAPGMIYGVLLLILMFMPLAANSTVGSR